MCQVFSFQIFFFLFLYYAPSDFTANYKVGQKKIPKSQFQTTPPCKLHTDEKEKKFFTKVALIKKISVQKETVCYPDQLLSQPRQITAHNMGTAPHRDVKAVSFSAIREGVKKTTGI